jgi:hypothetical protein
MTDVQENKLSMWMSTQNVVNKYSAVWSALGAYVTIFDEFEAKIQAVQDTRLVQEGDITGVAADKVLAKEAAITKGLEVSTAVFAFASVNNDNTLKAKVNYSPSELRRSRDTVLIDRLQVIHNEASAAVAVMVGYGIDGADLTELQGLINTYENLVEEPRAALTNRATATEDLVNLFSEGDKLLKEQLDKLMPQFETTSPKFYKQYFNARKIVDLGVRHEPEEPEVPPVG